jgi:hypothetical protein
LEDEELEGRDKVQQGNACVMWKVYSAQLVLGWLNKEKQSH